MFTLYLRRISQRAAGIARRFRVASPPLSIRNARLVCARSRPFCAHCQPSRRHVDSGTDLHGPAFPFLSRFTKGAHPGINTPPTPCTSTSTAHAHAPLAMPLLPAYHWSGARRKSVLSPREAYRYRLPRRPNRSGVADGCNCYLDRRCEAAVYSPVSPPSASS